MSRRTADQTAETERLLEEYSALWNERDYSKIPAVVSESFVRVSPVADDVRGRDGLEEFVRGLEASFSDFEITHHEQFVGENVATVESTFTGTHDGEFDGVPPVEVPNVSVFRFEGGTIQEHRTYHDPREFTDQLEAAEQ